MTSVLEGAKKLVTRGTDTGARIEGLAAAADAARGRLDDALVDEASEHHHRAHTEHSALDTQAIAHRSRAAEVRCHTLRPDEHSDSSPTM